MRSHELKKALLRGPLLGWDILVRGRYAFKYDQMPMLARGMSTAKRINLFKSGANLLHRRLNPWSMPLHMQFEVTNYCNLSCPVCPTGSKSMNRTAHPLDVDLFERVMDEVGPFLLTASLWAWGEPLLHPRLKDMLRVARRHDVITLLSTNGQNLNKEHILKALIEEPPTYLIVAFDGLCDETNSVYRVGARIAPILEGVKRLSEMKRDRGMKYPVLNMRFIVMKHNQHEVPLLDEFAAQHGFELLSIRSIFFIESTSSDRMSRLLAPDNKVWSACRYSAAKSARHSAFICMEPCWFTTLFSDGGLVLCEQDHSAQLTLGSVGVDGTFRELWFSKRAASLRKAIRDDSANVNCCRKCPYADRPATDFNVAVRSVENHSLR